MGNTLTCCDGGNDKTNLQQNFEEDDKKELEIAMCNSIRKTKLFKGSPTIPNKRLSNKLA